MEHTLDHLTEKVEFSQAGLILPDLIQIWHWISQLEQMVVLMSVVQLFIVQQVYTCISLACITIYLMISVSSVIDILISTLCRSNTASIATSVITCLILR